MESNSEDSTSDEEYIPPCKLSKCDSSDSDSCGSEDEGSEESLSNAEHVRTGDKISTDRQNDLDQTASSTNEEKKARDDAIWEEFLSSVETPPNGRSAKELVNVVRKYQFAGEEFEVTERISAPKSPENSVQNSVEPPPPIPSLSNHAPKTKVVASSGTRPLPTKVPSNQKSGLLGALKNIKALTGNKPNKLTTLEKSRLDWESFVRAEDIEDDLIAHNKGKQGYLERRAFVDRAAEREYEYQRNLANRKK
ncbi:unnamed protein product [Dicrocoelium dendriticum]|nr:unnamed protein product [Dicrocoelium dendriticum]